MSGRWWPLVHTAVRPVVAVGAHGHLPARRPVCGAGTWPGPARAPPGTPWPRPEGCPGRRDLGERT